MKSLVLITLTIVAFACPAQARRGEDMFRDSVWSSYERPFVMSDVARGKDMFPAVPLMLNPRAEMFQNVKRRPIAMNEDMFPSRRGRPMPYSPILTNDHWTQ